MTSIIDENLKTIFSEFYKIITTDRYIKIFFQNETQIKSVIEKQMKNIKYALSENDEELEKRFTRLGKYHFRIGVPFNIFLYGIDILSILFKKFSNLPNVNQIFNKIKNFVAKGYLLSAIENHTKILIPFYIDLQKEKVKEGGYEGYLQVHIFFLLNLGEAIKNENYTFLVIDVEDCPFSNWLYTDNAKNLLKEDYNFINVYHIKIHKIAKMLIEILKEKKYLEAVNLYNDIVDASLTILSYVRAHRESIFLEKKGKLQEVVRKLRKLSEHDIITGLHNEIRLAKTLNIQKKTGKTFYIAAFDIDDFRYVNQVYGYKIGNLLLKQIASVIKQESKNKKVFNFKTGSNTFISIILEKDAISFIKKLKKKMEDVEIETKIEGHTIKFFPKITVAFMKVDDRLSSPDEILETLEIVLHRGKLEKRGDIVEYNPYVDSKLEIAKLLDKQIFLGLAIKEEKIIPYFQPIFDLSTGKIFGYEVLFRIEKNGETVSAGEYIDIAYKTGLIVEIDKLVLKYLKSNLERLESFSLFINISAPFIKNKEFAQKIKGLPNAVYEITEQIAVDNVDKLKTIVKEYNTKMALDDFGSGYSSIKTVVELTTNKVISYLKLDGSLIKDIKNSKESFYIVESVVKMAKTLKLKTVAEFIEDEKTLKIVKDLGVDYAQGFYLGKPKPLSEILLIEHFHNKELFLKQFSKEIERIKRYKRKVSILKVNIEKLNLSDDKIFFLAEKILNKLRVNDLFVNWDNKNLIIVAPETDRNQALGIRNKILKIAKDFFNVNENNIDIFIEEINYENVFQIKNIKDFIKNFLNKHRK